MSQRSHTEPTCGCFSIYKPKIGDSVSTEAGVALKCQSHWFSVAFVFNAVKISWLLRPHSEQFHIYILVIQGVLMGKVQVMNFRITSLTQRWSRHMALHWPAPGIQGPARLLACMAAGVSSAPPSHSLSQVTSATPQGLLPVNEPAPAAHTSLRRPGPTNKHLPTCVWEATPTQRCPDGRFSPVPDSC